MANRLAVTLAPIAAFANKASYPAQSPRSKFGRSIISYQLGIRVRRIGRRRADWRAKIVSCHGCALNLDGRSMRDFIDTARYLLGGSFARVMFFLHFLADPLRCRHRRSTSWSCDGNNGDMGKSAPFAAGTRDITSDRARTIGSAFSTSVDRCWI